MIFQVGRIHLWMIVLIQWIKSGCCDMLLEIQFVDFINLKLLDQTCNVAFPSAKFLNEQSYFFQSTVKEILYVWRLVMVQDSNDETKALIIRNAFYMSGNQMSILKRVFYKVKANNDTNQELVLTMCQSNTLIFNYFPFFVVQLIYFDLILT